MSYDLDDDADRIYLSRRKKGLRLGGSNPHYPNKNEAKMLRKIMAQTHLTKEQVRACKKYRIMLAESAKVKAPSIDHRFKQIERRLRRREMFSTGQQHWQVKISKDDILNEFHRFKYRARSIF